MSGKKSGNYCFFNDMSWAVVIMTAVLLLISVRISAQTPCVGWATVDGTITGGEGGPVTTVSDETSLAGAVKGNSAKIIKISGVITLVEEIRPGSNTTIEGDAPGATIHGSLGLFGDTSADLTNVIVRNLILRKTGGGGMDAISVSRANHIWIDHNDIGDSPDGLVDVTTGSNYVTISWNIISYSSSSAAHRFAMLFGNTDSTDLDEGKLKITLHHNWFSNNVIERMPRIRFGQVHIFNNYYASAGNNYCIGPGFHAKAVVESNYFENVKDPHKFYNADTTAQIRINSDNQYINTTGKKDAGQGSAFVPPYLYTLDKGVDVKKTVMEGAGPFKTTAIQHKPVVYLNSKGSAAAPGRFSVKGFFTLQGRSIVPDQATPAAGPYIIVNEKPVIIITNHK